MSRAKLELPAKVRAVNSANQYALVVYNLLAPRFAEWVGKQIDKASGGLLDKVVKKLPNFEGSDSSLMVYRFDARYALAWVVKVCEPLPNGSCLYHETVVYIGEMRNGVLTSIDDAPDQRTDYTVEELEAKREAYAKAKKIADDALSALYPFGAGQ